MFWVILSFMALIAASAVLWPLYRNEERLSGRAAAAAGFVVLLSAFTYYQIGQPSARSLGTPDGTPPSVADMVTSLADRLEANPDDLEGWKMLGRSYLVMGRFGEAITALERAIELENSSDGLTLAALGEALFLQDNNSINGRAGQLFESSLSLVPGNPKGLFYSGLAASSRGDTELAIERWEGLLATSPPPEVANVLRSRIAEWRGESPPMIAAAPAEGVALTIDVAVGEEVAGIDPKTTIFVIARDPAQPAPPIAVDRRLAEELPARVVLDSRHEMLPGRSLANFAELEIVVRASASGQPRQASGDWFGTSRVNVANAGAINVEINQQVP